MGWRAWTSLPPPRRDAFLVRVTHILGNTLLTKVLNYYFELNFCRLCIYQRQSRICDTCHLNKLPIVSTSWNCFSESPWKGSDRQVESLSGYTLNPLDINCWPSLGLGVDPAAPRLSSERELRTQGGLLWTSWLNEWVLLLPLIRLPLPPFNATQVLGDTNLLLAQHTEWTELMADLVSAQLWT